MFGGFPTRAVRWRNKPDAIPFDLGSRRYCSFGLVLHMQDVLYSIGFMVVMALSLFFFTALVLVESTQVGTQSASRLIRRALPITCQKSQFFWFLSKDR
jgi:hypothetical protein